jgi:hypothetical protein
MPRVHNSLVAEEIFREMEKSEAKAAFEYKYADDIKRLEAIEKLNQAAETFETLGRTALAHEATQLLLKLAQPTVGAPPVSPEELEAIEKAQRQGTPERSDVKIALMKAHDMLMLARQNFADNPEVVRAIEAHLERILHSGKPPEEQLQDIRNFNDILAATTGEPEEEDVAYAKDKKAKSILDKLNQMFGMFGFKLTEKDAEKLK